MICDCYHFSWVTDYDGEAGGATYDNAHVSAVEKRLRFPKSQVRIQQLPPCVLQDSCGARYLRWAEYHVDIRSHVLLTVWGGVKVVTGQWHATKAHSWLNNERVEGIQSPFTCFSQTLHHRHRNSTKTNQVWKGKALQGSHLNQQIWRDRAHYSANCNKNCKTSPHRQPWHTNAMRCNVVRPCYKQWNQESLWKQWNKLTVEHISRWFPWTPNMKLSERVKANITKLYLARAMLVEMSWKHVCRGNNFCSSSGSWSRSGGTSSKSSDDDDSDSGKINNIHTFQVYIKTTNITMPSCCNIIRF